MRASVCPLVIVILTLPALGYRQPAPRARSSGTPVVKPVAGGGAYRPPGLGDGGPATHAFVAYPIDVAVDASGNVFIAQVYMGQRPHNSGCEIREVLARTGTIRTVFGIGLRRRPAGGTPALRTLLRGCWGVAVGSDDGLFVADDYDNVVDRVDLPSGSVRIVAGCGDCDRLGDGGPATGASLYDLTGIATDGRGDLFIADPNHSRIRMVDPRGIIHTIAGNGHDGFSGDGGKPARAELNSPEAVAVDGRGNVFIADTGNDRVREVVAATGTIRTVAGGGRCSSNTYAYCGEGRRATRAQVPLQSIAVDGHDDVFIASAERVLEVLASTGRIRTVAGSGQIVSTRHEAQRQLTMLTARKAEVWPMALAVDGRGNVVMADGRVYTVRELTLGR